MSERSLETQFIAFRATRDPKALAAVFDATAAELLLVAVHLVGDRTEAEDVLQSTFVELIERAEKWDSARPLLPWIVGVLANRARMALRRRRRAPAQGEAKLEVEPPAAEAGPADAAHASEVAQHVSRALAGLPPRYRQVLVLHLVHGLGGVQIAQALMLPPATVRTQIKRGLELLRGALPRALAVPPALLLCEGRGLAAVKVAVLEHAGAVGTTAAAAAGVATLSGVTLGKLGGILLMKKLLLGVLALVLGVSVWIGLERGSGDSARPASEPSARSTPQPEGLPASDVGIAPASSATREAMALTPATNGSTIVRGRVVAAWNGRPLVASRVEIHATIDGADGIPSTYATLASGGSLADGSFERSFVARPRARHSISIAGGEFVPASGDIAVSGPGLLDLGDLRVERGSLLRVRIVDEQDRPVPNVSFVLETEAATLEGKTRMWGGAESDDEGILKPHDDQRVLPGEVSLEPRGPWEIVDPSRFLVATGIETSAPKVVVRPIREQDTLAGKVTDARGNGIAGVRVLVHFAQDRGFTGKDGGFRIYRKPADGASTRTTLSFVGSDKAVGVADVPVVWGAQDLSVVLPDAFTVPLLVVADDTGVPITEYRACFGGSNDPMFGRHDLAKHWRGGTHPGGRTELKGVPGSGKLCLIVAPSKGDHERSQQLEFDLPRTEPIVVRLLQRRPCSVLVADSEGKPVSGSRVQLIQLAGTEPAAEDPRPLPRADSWRNLQLRPQQPRPTWLIDEGTTDAAGMVRLAQVERFGAEMAS